MVCKAEAVAGAPLPVVLDPDWWHRWLLELLSSWRRQGPRPPPTAVRGKGVPTWRREVRWQGGARGGDLAGCIPPRLGSGGGARGVVEIWRQHDCARGVVCEGLGERCDRDLACGRDFVARVGACRREWTWAFGGLGFPDSYMWGYRCHTRVYGYAGSGQAPPYPPPLEPLGAASYQ